jgi:hypothetical protein
MTKVLRAWLIVIAAVAALVAATTTVGASAATCPPPPSDVYPFIPWQDANAYVISTGGDFEGSAPWSLAGGAKVVSGDNAPNSLDPSGDSHALYLPAGSSVTSACVTAPQIVGIVRMFAKSTGGSLKVEVLVKGGVYDAGSFTAGSSWAPSPMLRSNAPNYKGAVTYQVRLTNGGSGSFTLDDVYFDPYVQR